ncbi:MAG: TIGR02281 family clan AA aspartic protease [Betaproteobacteria bacterium]|nr:TIGR02281 family clan AA aspartic protease [Betaproteobacteria bacterium]
MSSRHFIASALASLLGCAIAGTAIATNVTVVGLFPNKAVVQIDGGAPRTLSIGTKTAEGVTLLSVERDSATFDIQGKRATLRMGQQHASSNAPSSATVVLKADSRGHFITEGQVNGLPIRFIVDTGATVIAIPLSDARRLALDYRRGQPVIMSTANGQANGYRIRLDTVRIGDITVNNVDAVVLESSAIPAALLGMSFLNRMQMRRDGETMTLIRRF